MEKTYRILVVDSEPDFVAMARETLEGAFKVSLASSLKEGLEKANKEALDLVIVGYLEPRGTSYKFHKELRKGGMTKHIPMLVVDVRPEEHSRKGWRRDEGMRMDAEDYVSRPIEPADLREAVEGILRRVEEEPMELEVVLDQMEKILKRIDGIEERLVK